jgi:hypothetical protein
MKTLFLAADSLEMGSTRIWVHDLHEYFGELGYHSAINDEENLTDYDVVILAKGQHKRVLEVKTKHPRALVGNINLAWIPARFTRHLIPKPSPGHQPDEKEWNDVESERAIEEMDFLIVGSVEEGDRVLCCNENVFMFPLVERMYTRVKVHSDHEPIVIGYHGNDLHLMEFYPHLTAALETLAKEFPIKLLAISTSGRNWQTGRPEIDDIEELAWRADSVEEQLLRCDIGLAPGLSHVSPEERLAIAEMLKANYPERPSLGDYVTSFKGFSNAGRAFVFHQLGIPAVACFMPSHFHILANPDCGYLAHSTEGWLRALRALCSSARKRQEMADAARAEFNRLYNPLDWARRLYGQLEELMERDCLKSDEMCRLD